MATILSARREPHTRWERSALDQPVHVGRASGVEEHVTLPDGGLGGEQPRVQQGLADLLRERAVVAGEAAREVREVGVVAAPLAHAVEALEDAAGYTARGIGVLVGADRGRM